MNVSRLCDNSTPLVVEPFVLDDRHGHEVAVAVAKLTWVLGADGEPRIGVPSRSVRAQHEFGSASRLGALDYPSDMVEDKPGTDVILVGNAYPADDGATDQVVSLRIEAGSRTIHKAVRVFGPRVFEQGLTGIAPGKAAPLEVTPLVYELAFGGMDDSGVEPKIDWRNPVGRGLAIDTKTLLGKPAFVIESDDGNDPAGFGAIAEHWTPRRQLAGTYDEKWSKKRAPLRPTDFDLKHHAACHPDLWSETPLMGDEPVEVLGATPEKAWHFRLPRYAPRFAATIDGETTPLETHLDTYLIDLSDPERRLVELTWRAAVRLPRKTERLESIAIMPDGELGDEIYVRLNEDLAQLRAKLENDHDA